MDHTSMKPDMYLTCFCRMAQMVQEQLNKDAKILGGYTTKESTRWLSTQAIPSFLLLLSDSRILGQGSYDGVLKKLISLHCLTALLEHLIFF